MTTTQTTAEAAHTAGVTPRTIRTWCQRGAVTAVKVNGRWVVDVDSLRHRISLSRRTVEAQLAAFTDARTAEAKALELLELGALVQWDRFRYLAAATSGNDYYVVDTLIGSCTCKGYTYSGHCYHLVAAVALETRVSPLLALAA
jgi:hypothetical protein